MRRAPLAGLAVFAATILTIPLAITSASWNDAEWVHGASVGTSRIDCDTDDDFAASASGRFLGGSLLGTDLDSLAQLTPMELAATATSVAASPPGASDLGSPPPTYTFANPLQITALGGIAGLDLSGLQIGLPAGSAGAVNQWTRVSTTGQARGASGLISNSGGVLVSPTAPPSSLPQPATISLDSLMPAVAGVEASRLRVGAVSAMSALDGCEALRSALWGDGTVSAVTREYGIASLGLRLQSSLVGTLTSQVNAGVVTIGNAVAALTGTNGAIASLVRASIQASLPLGLAAAATTGSVTVTGLDLPGAVAPLLSTPLSDGVVTIDLINGYIDVDLAALLGGPPNGLNNLPPNTELVINDDVLNPLLGRIGALLDSWTQRVTNALADAVRAATLTVSLSTVVSIVSGAVQVLRTDVSLSGSIASILAGTAAVTVTTDVLGLAAVLNTLLAPLGTTLTALRSLISGLATGIRTAVADLITTTVLQRVNELGATLAATSAAIVSAAGGIIGALPSVLSVMVNVQPDQAGAPPGSEVVGATPRSTGRFDVTALRIGLAGWATPSGIAHVSFGTATAGPVTLPPP